MNDFYDKLLKIRSGFLSRMRFLFILDLISIFSIFYAIFIIFNVEFFLQKYSLYLPISIKIIPLILAFIIALAGASLMHKRDRKINVTLLIENKYPELEERLRTAYDNRSETNIIVESLKSYVSDALNGVSSSQLLAKGKIISRILVAIIFIAGAATISLSPEKYSLPPDTLTNISNTITGGTGGETGPIEVVGRPENIDKMGTRGGGDIFGKPKIASIEGKNIDLTIYTGMDIGNTPSEYKPGENQFIQSAVFPVDVLGSNVSDGGYSTLMKKTEIEKELINKYAVERSKI